MINFNNVYKSYPSQELLVNVNFRINPGERVGLVGPNGAGKSTIFSLIMEEILPDKGSVSIPKNVRMGYLRQQLPDHEKEQTILEYATDAIPELTKLHGEIHAIEKEIAFLAPEKIDSKLIKLGHLQSKFESMGGYDLDTRAQIILSGLGFPEKRFGDKLIEFSGGWQMRAGLARVLVADPEIMLLDEPSNYLDIPAIEWLQRYLRAFKGTLVLISHDRYLLKSLTSVTVEVANGDVTRYAGNYDFYERERLMRIKSISAAKQNQDRKKEQIERFVERFRAKNTKASQVKSRMKVLDKMEDIRVSAHRNNSVIKIPSPPHSGAEIIRLENAAVNYGNDEFKLEALDLRIERGQKIAIIGYNGMGKTTLLKILAGMLPLNSGKRVLGHKVIIGYQAQEFADILPPEQTLFDIVHGALPVGADAKQIRSVLASFGFTGDNIDKPCEVLSGGEKIRLAFARIFINPPNFLILDEPTTHLDLHTRESLQKSLKSYKGTLCFVSHDIEFVRNTADTIIAMTPPGIKRYYGNYDYYCEKSEESLSTEESAKKRKITSDDPKLRRRERAEKREAMSKQKNAAVKETQKIEQHIEKLEAEKVKITARIEANEPNLDFYAVNKRLVEIEEDITQLSVKWDIAAENLETIMKEYNAIHE